MKTIDPFFRRKQHTIVCFSGMQPSWFSAVDEPGAVAVVRLSAAMGRGRLNLPACFTRIPRRRPAAAGDARAAATAIVVVSDFGDWLSIYIHAGGMASTVCKAIRQGWKPHTLQCADSTVCRGCVGGIRVEG